MFLKFKYLIQVIFILFAVSFMSSCFTPKTDPSSVVSGGNPSNPSSVAFGDDSRNSSSQYRVVCKCGSDSRYVVGVGSDQRSAESQAQQKCQTLQSSVRDCRQSRSRN